MNFWQIAVTWVLSSEMRKSALKDNCKNTVETPKKCEENSQSKIILINDFKPKKEREISFLKWFFVKIALYIRFIIIMYILLSLGIFLMGLGRLPNIPFFNWFYSFLKFLIK